MDSFSSLGLDEPIAKALSSLGYATPTAVQAGAIPALLAGHDILMESETGTGKTFAYLAPALQLLAAKQAKGPPLVLVAAPTQELAVQIGKEASRLAGASGIEVRSVVLLGGSPLSRQAGLLHGSPGLVIGTLGRLADLVAMGALRLGGLGLLVLDEADRLLSPETEDAALMLLGKAPRTCVRALVSATLPHRVRGKAAPFLHEPVDVSVAADRAVISGDIEHWCFFCDGRKRLDFLRRLEIALKPKRCLVFTSQASRVETVAGRLEALGLPVAGIHARLDKEERRVALEKFSEGRIRYLVTSDLGARGLDIPGLTHVVSLDLPEEPTVYIHRAGRTGRAGAKGVSIVLADGVELRRASKLAVKEGFVFRCKFLEGGKILEPMPEEFFERAERAERQKDEKRAEREARRAETDSSPSAPRGGRSPAPGMDRTQRHFENRTTRRPAREGRPKRGKDGDGTRS
jgi:superfamily II DNA/RNA helicase